MQSLIQIIETEPQTDESLDIPSEELSTKHTYDLEDASLASLEPPPQHTLGHD